MDRQIVYPGAIPLETDILNAQKNDLVGLAMACQAMLGTGPLIDGLACTPTTPASLSVTIGTGSLYAQAPIDSSAYSSLGSDTRTIVKQGLSLSPATLSFTPPTTVGYSQNFLIEAAYLDSDTGPVVLPYYNASNPNQAYSGPNNAGSSQNTVRQGLISIQAKAGIAAASGSQTTPVVDAGYTALYVVTLAYGATQITTGNIAAVASAPFITPKLGQVPAALQAQSGNFGSDSGSANAYVVTLIPAPTTIGAGTPVRFKAANANSGTGGSTLNVGGLGAAPLKRADGTVLQVGDIVANQMVAAVFDGASWLMVGAVPFSLLTLQQQAGNYVVDSGAVNALVVTPSPAVTALTAGLTLRVKVAVSNTGASTVAVSGLGAVPVKRRDGTVLQVNDLVAGGIVQMTYEPVSGAFQVHNTTVTLPGGTQIFTSSGTFTVPAGVTSVRVITQGGGGGGGGGGTLQDGGGGGGSGYEANNTSYNLAPGTQVTVTIGAAGSAGTVGVAGGTGGTTSFGSYQSSFGGTGGAPGINSPAAGGTGGNTGGLGAGGSGGQTAGGGGYTGNLQTINTTIFNKNSYAPTSGLPAGSSGTYVGGGGGGGISVNGTPYGTGGTGGPNAGGAAVAALAGVCVVEWG